MVLRFWTLRLEFKGPTMLQPSRWVANSIKVLGSKRDEAKV